MRKQKRIEVQAMAGMTRKQVKMSNGVANTLISQHGMCLDCAIKFAVAFVWGQERNPTKVEFCSKACGNAVLEFFEQTLGSEPERVSPDELPWRTN